MNHTNIPQTDSIQELADVWDTHDLTDFEDELEEVTEPVFENLVFIQLKPEELEIIEILTLNAQTYKDSWKEKAGNSKTPKKVSS